jgi:FtsZ-binding cell division protein ZapB
MQLVKLEKIRIDCGTQSRVKLDETMINEFVEKMEEGEEFPAVHIIHDGNNYYLADGFHRYFATKKMGKTEIKSNVINGTLTEAILYSKDANTRHGKRFTIEDKIKNVTEMLEHFEFGDWSDREIARRCGVSATFVGKKRKELKGGRSEPVKYTRNGKEQEMKVKPAKKEKPAKPAKETAQLSTMTEEQSAVIDMLKSENDRLTEEIQGIKDELDIKYYEATPEEKVAIIQTVDELREENRKLRIDLEAVKKSRDQFQNENAQLKRTIAALNKQLKK